VGLGLRNAKRTWFEEANLQFYIGKGKRFQQQNKSKWEDTTSPDTKPEKANQRRRPETRKKDEGSKTRSV
jgi:hypothetical protein